MIKHICFDFDGVILDSLQIHLDTFKEVFDLEYTHEEFARFLDGNFRDSEVGDLDWDKYNAVLQPKYKTRQFDQETIDSLQALSQTYSLSINSSADDDMLRAICEFNNVDHLFTTIWGSRNIRYKTEKFTKLMNLQGLDSEEIVFVTDTLGDIREANEVSIPTIAITGGFHDRNRLQQAETVALVDSWSELMQIIESLNTK